MTPRFLQDAIIEDMRELLPKVLLGSADAPFRFYAQNLPPRREAKDLSIYPFCRVILGDGEDSGDSSGSEATQDVAIVICIRDESPDMQGHQDLMNVIQRIREKYCKNPAVGGIFDIIFPIKWGFPEEDDLFPLFFGAVQFKAVLPQEEIDSELA